MSFSEAPRPTKRKQRRIEAPIQEAICDFLELNFPPDGPVFWSATLNGVFVTPKVRARLRREGLRPGVLDVCVIPLRDHPSVGQTFWMEVKPPGGRPTPEQKATLAVLIPLGLGVIVRSPQDAERFLLSAGFTLRATLS